jgi:hypothetical protein
MLRIIQRKEEERRKAKVAQPRDLFTPPPIRLDRESNNVRREKDEGRNAVLHAHRCKTRTCPYCGPRMGRRVRARLLEKAREVVVPRLLTLTVDRKRFKSPEEAWQYVTDHRLVPRLMEDLGVLWWFAGLEFQMQTGHGWPHWHVMIDLEGLKGRIDLKRAWHLWRDKWGVGGLDLGKEHDAQNTETAVRYVTKYVVKYPKAGFPQWVMQKNRIRFVMASKAVGALVTQRGKVASTELPELVSDEMTREFHQSSLEERGAQCGRFSRVIVQSNGVSSWGGEVPFLPGALAYASRLGLITRPIRMVTVEDRYGGLRLEVSIPMEWWENVEDVLSGLMREMEQARSWGIASSLASIRRLCYL